MRRLLLFMNYNYCVDLVLMRCLSRCRDIFMNTHKLLAMQAYLVTLQIRWFRQFVRDVVKKNQCNGVRYCWRYLYLFFVFIFYFIYCKKPLVTEYSRFCYVGYFVYTLYRKYYAEFKWFYNKIYYNEIYYNFYLRHVSHFLSPIQPYQAPSINVKINYRFLHRILHFIKTTKKTRISTSICNLHHSLLKKSTQKGHVILDRII